MTEVTTKKEYPAPFLGVYLSRNWVKSSVSNISKGLDLPDAINKLKFDKKKYKASNSKNWHPDQWIFDPRNFVESVTEGTFGAMA